MQFVGVSERNVLARLGIMDEVCYQKVAESLKKGFQAMVFVHRCAQACSAPAAHPQHSPAAL
jgi:replicative superfamily II helicase